MATKYIVDNLSGQTITGGLTISGGTSILSNAPTSIIGSEGDKVGQLAFDENYLYYCVKDYAAATSLIVSGGGTTHIFDADPNSAWDTYGMPYLQVGAPQEVGLTPLAGWYIVDDLGTIRQVTSNPAWFTGGAPTPITNGPGWFFVLDGSYTYSVNNPTITFYETLPTVVQSPSAGSGNIWGSVKLDKELNTTGVYRALLTQTGQITGYGLNDFNSGLIIGETYTINSYSPGDDFSNIADVQSGTINDTGCVFIATGEIPANYNNGSELISDGGLVVTVLENSLGFDIGWEWAPFGGYGYYIGVNTEGPYQNGFPRNNTQITTQLKYPFNSGPFFQVLFLTPGVGGFMGKDDIVFLDVYNYDINDLTDNALYYTPIEIRIKKDITPIQINGSITSSFPFSNVAYNLVCNGGNISTFYSSDLSTVNNITELITILNTNEQTNQLGVFSDDGLGNLILTMVTDTKQHWCQDGTLTFEVFAD